MKRFASLSLLAALAVLLPAVPPALAQMGTNVPRIFGSFEPKPGAWSEDTVTDKDGGAEVRMRMAIVEREGGAFWHEVRDGAEGVSPFGLVISGTGSSSMTLTGYGSDAVSAITEEPVPMNMPPGMPQGMPQGMPPGMKGPSGR